MLLSLTSILEKNLPTLKVLFIITLVLSLTACQSITPRLISKEALLSQHKKYLADNRKDLDRSADKARKRFEYEYNLEQSSKEEQFYDVLVLSGGGAFGAFGAGFLKGWSSVKNPNYKLPVFDSVSGISTGSLIAPFAFIGSAEAYDKIIELYSNPGRDWATNQGWLSYLPGNASVYNIDKLRDKIASVVDEQMLKQISVASKNDRQLLIGATNMDFGLLRVWDIADISTTLNLKQSVDKTLDALNASSAIPALFPPVEIDNLLYADGGATMQIIGGTSTRDWVYDKKPQLKFVKPNKPVKIRVWIIINQKLLAAPELVKPTWTSLASRGLTTVLKASTLQSLQDSASFIKLLDAHPDFSAEMHYVAIPQDFKVKDSANMFEAETMRNLVKLGIEMGADINSWKPRVLPPGAPFLRN